MHRRAQWLALIVSLAFVSILALVCALFLTWATDRAGDRALRSYDRDAAALQGLIPDLLGVDTHDLGGVGQRRRAELDRAVREARRGDTLVSVTLWRPDGLAVYSSDPRVDGHRYAASAALQSALGGTASIVTATGDGSSGLVRSYAPVGGDSGAPAGALEVERRGEDLAAALTTEHRDLYLVIGLLGLLLWLALLPVATRVGRAAAAPRRGRRRVVRAIRRGIERNEFELHYQPQIDLGTGSPCGVEALLRWRRRGELLCPPEFLADAEASDVIDPLTAHVLDLALSQAGEWHRAGRGIPVAVNLSAANLRDFSVVERLESLLSKHGVPASVITLEVTETAVLDEPEQTRAVLDAMAELGVSISVDDFGTGYSSLLWLRLFPVDEVKIDRTFVSSMRAEGEAYVAGVIRLGHDLGLSVIAEGIEDDATLKTLQELGCDVGQGYLFAKPLPPAAIDRWLWEKTDNPWAPQRKEICVSAGERGLDEARRLIEETASELGFDEEATWDMKLAATEALTNAMEHGPPGPDGKVHLRLAKDHDNMLLEVWGGASEDRTPGVDDSHGGRGIAIMTALMDDVELKRDAERGLIRLAKRPS